LLCNYSNNAKKAAFSSTVYLCRLRRSSIVVVTTPWKIRCCDDH